MTPSTEVRWFFEATIPKSVSDWFDLFHAEEEDPRTDYYLNHTGTARLGIKLREENIQIKTHIANLALPELMEIVEGQVAKYEKWNFPVISNEEWSTLIQRPEVWIPVKKMRKMMLFTLEGGYPDPVDMEERLEEGCEVELSQVEVMDKPYWSIAFEAFGQASDINLQKTVQEIFETHSCPASFTKEKSFGYARLIYNTPN